MPQARIQSPLELELNQQGPAPGCWAVCGCVDESFDAEGAPVSCPWFYPVVEQHDVTYHRVKPLAGHRERHTGREPHQKPTKPGEVTTDKKNDPSAGWDQHRRLHHQQQDQRRVSPAPSEKIPPTTSSAERSPQPRRSFSLLGPSACRPRRCFPKQPVNFCGAKVTQCSEVFQGLYCFSFVNWYT